ncbi:MAG: hypothetical protein ABIR46_02190 [Candidatus Saccharimonadales bacterium]
MDVSTQIKTASIVTILAGLWTASTPLFTTVSDANLMNLLVVGGSLMILGIVQLNVKSSIPSAITVLLALWLVASALIFAPSALVMWSMIVTGMMTFFVGVWDGFEVSTYTDRLRPSGHL